MPDRLYAPAIQPRNKIMKFSISLTSGTDRPISAKEITAFAQEAETLGYHALYITDHYYHNHPNFHSISAAAVLCAATERVKLGFSAYQVPLRHPIAVAKKFTMLDALSEGRTQAGCRVDVGHREPLRSPRCRRPDHGLRTSPEQRAGWR